ncbi:hypothetical protein [Altererythrobacter lutimaris]|uniref:Uncharacterized protein n=1 Tax=Altererythrobacter lutimaris TaxID=2743979 RepID=A0A850H7X6_9SPHN|nr:hypothetical protein [Altererythrobacter lutimaris]NVE95374.1 hypothetical protein [Altererythrobacter lutimaris]
MDAIKAIVLGGILSGIISLIIGSQGSSGGQLAIHLMHAGDYSIHWSWPLFLAGTGLSYGIMVMQR